MCRVTNTTAPAPADAADAADGCDMTNVDGLFAKEFIPAGSIVLWEEELPDLELPSEPNPSCEVVFRKNKTWA